MRVATTFSGVFAVAVKTFSVMTSLTFMSPPLSLPRVSSPLGCVPSACTLNGVRFAVAAYAFKTGTSGERAPYSQLDLDGARRASSRRCTSSLQRVQSVAPAPRSGRAYRRDAAIDPAITGLRSSSALHLRPPGHDADHDRHRSGHA